MTNSLSWFIISDLTIFFLAVLFLFLSPSKLIFCYRKEDSGCRFSSSSFLQRFSVPLLPFFDLLIQTLCWPRVSFFFVPFVSTPCSLPSHDPERKPCSVLDIFNWTYRNIKTAVELFTYIRVQWSRYKFRFIAFSCTDTYIYTYWYLYMTDTDIYTCWSQFVRSSKTTLNIYCIMNKV